MKTKMGKIWAGLALAGSLMAGSGVISAATIWQFNGTIGPGAGNTWAAGNGPGAWKILDQGPTSGGGDGDALFTFDPVNSTPLAGLANVVVSIFEDETAGQDTYSIEFNHGTTLTVLPNGARFAYAVDFTGPEVTAAIKQQALSYGLFSPNATKTVYASVADYLAGNPLLSLTDTGNSPAPVSLTGYSHLYIVDTINNDLTTSNVNGIGVKDGISTIPEIDALASTGALTLLGAALALAGERRRKLTPETAELA